MIWSTDITSDRKPRISEVLWDLRIVALILCLVAGPASATVWAAGLVRKIRDTASRVQGNDSGPLVSKPNSIQPLYLRPRGRNFGNAQGYFPNPVAPYMPISVTLSHRVLKALTLAKLMRNGKIYLSLNDAVLLALENNYDIAIQRLNLDIADTDILRARTGSGLSLSKPTINWICNHCIGCASGG